MPAIIAILITNLIWGAAPPIFKFALEDIPPFTLAFIRFFGAALIFLPFAIGKWQSITKQDWKHIILGGFWGISINVSFFFLGLQLAPSINVSVISALGPVMLYVLSLRILREKAHPQIIHGMLISLLGACAIIFAPLIKAGAVASVTGSSGSATLLGNLFFILATLGSVLFSINGKQVVGRVHPFVVTFIQFTVGSLPFFPLMLYELQTWSFDQLTTQSWVGIWYGMLLSSAVAYFCLNYALTKMHAQEIGVFSYIMPVITVIVAIPLLGEYPDAYFMVGALCVFLGIFISERHPHYRKVGRKLHER